MTGDRSPRRKGIRIEQELVRQLAELGIPCSRVPLSGALGGEYSGDIHLELGGRIRRVEVKARREFRTLHSWLSSAELLILRADRCQPLLVAPLPLITELAPTKFRTAHNINPTGPRDRAAVVTTAITQLIGTTPLSDELRCEIETTLRDEFADLAREIAAEREPLES